MERANSSNGRKQSAEDLTFDDVFDDHDNGRSRSPSTSLGASRSPSHSPESPSLLDDGDDSTSLGPDGRRIPAPSIVSGHRMSASSPVSTSRRSADYGRRHGVRKSGGGDGGAGGSDTNIGKSGGNTSGGGSRGSSGGSGGSGGGEAAAAASEHAATRSGGGEATPPRSKSALHISPTTSPVDDGVSSEFSQSHETAATTRTSRHRLSPDNFDLLCVLGKGAYGKVVQCMHKETKKVGWGGIANVFRHGVLRVTVVPNALVCLRVKCEGLSSVLFVLLRALFSRHGRRYHATSPSSFLRYLFSCHHPLSLSLSPCILSSCLSWS
jgi:hypothetical protein